MAAVASTPELNLGQPFSINLATVSKLIFWYFATWWNASKHSLDLLYLRAACLSSLFKIMLYHYFAIASVAIPCHTANSPKLEMTDYQDIFWDADTDKRTQHSKRHGQTVFICRGTWSEVARWLSMLTSTFMFPTPLEQYLSPLCKTSCSNTWEEKC